MCNVQRKKNEITFKTIFTFSTRNLEFKNYQVSNFPLYFFQTANAILCVRICILMILFSIVFWVGVDEMKTHRVSYHVCVNALHENCTIQPCVPYICHLSSSQCYGQYTTMHQISYISLIPTIKIVVYEPIQVNL